MERTETKNYFFVVVFLAVVIKLALFIYSEAHYPQAKFQTDTQIYLESGINLVEHGVFAKRDGNGILDREIFRTPGYPVFLGLLHGLMKIPLGDIIFFQIILTLIAAFITYKTAVSVDHRLGYLSALIVLYEPPVTIFSLMLLTEALFLFLISLFMLVFISYLREEKIKWLILSSLILVMATYVRPVSYYLGVVICVFIIYAVRQTSIKKSFAHALIFFIIIYSLLGIWHFRNYQVSSHNTFCYRSNLDYEEISENFSKNDDPFAQKIGPVFNSLNVFSRSLLRLMTSPGSFKDFNSPFLKEVLKILAYPWVVFWLIGFLFGIGKIENNFYPVPRNAPCFSAGGGCALGASTGSGVYFQFMLWVIVYFICVPIFNIPWSVGPRFRVPMVPFIAILSANGWMRLIYLIKNRN